MIMSGAFPAIVHRTLKQETADLHARIENRLDVDAHLGSASDYRVLLERFLGVLEPMERALSRFDWPAELDIDARRKVPLLVRDLTDLGHTSASLAQITRAPAVQLMPTRAAALGFVYVLEGSTLGGRIILRKVQAALGFDADRGAAYFAGYGSRTGAMWMSLLRSLAVEIASPADLRQAIAAARCCFAILDRWLNGCVGDDASSGDCPATLHGRH